MWMLAMVQQPVMLAEMVTFMSRMGPNTMEGNQQKTEMYGNVTLWLFNIAMENHHF
jgi:hypothetical protein